MVNDFQLVYPMFGLVLITAAVQGTLFRRRMRAVRAGKVSTRYFRIYQGEVEPEEAAKAARHLLNLFEAPTLFYPGANRLRHRINAYFGGWLALMALWVHVVMHVALASR